MKFEKLENLAKIQIGKTPKRAEPEYWGKGFPWVSISDLQSEVIENTKEEITEKAIKECGCKLIPKGTLIMSFKLSVGKLAFAGKDLYTNEAICGFFIKESETLDSKYFYYALKNTRFTGSNTAVMGNTLNTDSLNNLKIPYTSDLQEQKHIAAVLSKAETLIAERKQSIQLLDEYLKSTFLEMFGDPVKNEKGWEKNKVIQYVDCIVPGRDKPKSFTGNIPWIRTEDLVNKGYVYNSLDGIGLTKEEINEVNGKIIPKDSVIMTCVGKLNVISINKVDCIINQQLHSFQCHKDMNNLFLMYSLSFQEKFMYQNASTTTVPYMNKTICNSIPTINPPIKLQTQFAQIVEKTEALKAQYKKHLQELEQLYGALSQRAFRGGLCRGNLSERV